MLPDRLTVYKQIEQQKARWSEQVLATWQQITAEWRADDPEDRTWLMYSANYLLRTGGVRWAIDPFTLNARLPHAPRVNAAESLRPLSFVLLTHRHADHLDLALIHELRDVPVRWVVPDFLVAPVEEAGVPRARLMVPKMLEPVQIDGVTITPFPGLHWEYDASGTGEPLRGVPAVGYLAVFGQKRWLFPGDTRCYDAAQLPNFGPVDAVFAHLWLGRGCALMDRPPLLDAFCRFFLSLQPRQIVVTHLNELGRAPEDYWDERHYALVREQFQQLAPHLPVSACFAGCSVAFD